MWNQSLAILCQLGDNLSQLGAKLEATWASLVVCNNLVDPGVKIGNSSGPEGAKLEPSWDHVGSSRAYVTPYWVKKVLKTDFENMLLPNSIFFSKNRPLL